MKGTIEFDLPLEEEEFQTAVDGMKRKIVLSNLDNWLRGLNKYESLETVDVTKARAKIQELLDEWDLEL